MKKKTKSREEIKTPLKLKFLVASDHGGRKEKLKVLKALQDLNYDFYDCSKRNNIADDYPDFAKIVGQEVASSKNRFGILLCGTGIGMSIAANKIKGIRAALCAEKKDAELARKHNNANILVLRGWKPHSQNELKSIIKNFAETKYEGQRHERRIGKITDLEKIQQ